MIYVYRLILNLAIPFGLLGLVFRGFKNSAYWHRWGERFGFANTKVKQAAPFDLWVHAVSVGEVRAATPLIKRFIQENPEISILLTTTTPTGSAMVKMMLQDKVAHCYFPYDLGWAMKKFTALVNAKAVLIMETEIWPNMIAAVKQAGSTLIYTNVRLSERSYLRYAKFPKWVGQTLSQIDHFAVQGKLDSQHLQALGVVAEKISETGSIKFDFNVPASLQDSANALRQKLGQDRQIWIAGSTREGEESQILAVHKQLKSRFPKLLLILVPRHPERFDQVARKIQKQDLACVRRTTEDIKLDASMDVYLGDTMGELSLMYACSDVAFVGGSLEPLGGQNILEPCALGVPVVFGPHMFNFPDISQWTIKEGAGRMVQNAGELFLVVSELLSEPSVRKEMGGKGKAFVEAHRGSLEKNHALIKNLM